MKKEEFNMKNSNNRPVQVSLRFTPEQHKYLVDLAVQKGMSLTSFLKQQILPTSGPETLQKIVTLDDIDQAVQKLPSGKQFKIKQLFDITFWNSFSKSSRLAIGRIFYTNINKNPSFQDKYKFIKKTLIMQPYINDYN